MENTWLDCPSDFYRVGLRKPPMVPQDHIAMEGSVTAIDTVITAGLVFPVLTW